MNRLNKRLNDMLTTEQFGYPELRSMFLTLVLDQFFICFNDFQRRHPGYRIQVRDAKLCKLLRGSRPFNELPCRILVLGAG